jgi:hypothetical protein
VISKSKLGIISIIVILMLSLTVSLVEAQYETQKTADVAIASDGTCTICDPDLGLTYVIEGNPGATGTVTTAVYNGNPQPSANVPDRVSLGHFLVVTFGMTENDFSQATVTITYTDSDVANLQAPYSVFKYIPDTDSYVSLPTTVDTVSKTMTVTLTSVADPLLAIGGSSNADSTAPISMWAWIAVTVAVVFAVMIIAFTVVKIRRSS